MGRKTLTLTQIQIDVYSPDDSKRPLATFLLVSLLLHLALLAIIRPPTSGAPVAASRPLDVYFSIPPVIVPIRVPKRTVTVKEQVKPVFTPTTQNMATNPPVEATPPPDPAASLAPLYSREFIESARMIARDQGKKAEQQIAADEKKRLNSPIGLLEQYMRLPHKELRLANGILMVTTSFGRICYRPVPTFARDSAGLFGIPTTCP